MKILLYVSSLSLKSGGPSRSVPMMAKGLSENGVDVTLMTSYSDDMNTHALDGTNVRVVALKNGVGKEEIEALIEKEKFDIVQMQSIWSLDYHRLAQICRRHNIPYIITPRGMLEPWSLSQKKWKKRIALMLYQKRDLNKAACIYTTSEMEAQHIKNLGIISSCAVIPNGIETEGYPCRTSMDTFKKQVLFLSRIHEKKGIELLIDTWGNLVTSYPEWKLLIVGNGDEEYIKLLNKKVIYLGLQNSIEIKPPVFGDAKVDLYQSSSLFVLPSYSENFGMVIAEAMSCGVPVITSEYTPWHFLNNTNTGWCIPLTHEELEKVLRLAMNKDPRDLFDMGVKASKLIQEKFNYANVAKQTLALYDWIIDGGISPKSTNEFLLLSQKLTYKNGQS